MSVSSVLFATTTRGRAARWLSILTDVCLALVVVIVPGFSAMTFERAELFKQALLVVLVGLALVARVVRAALERRWELVLGWPQVLLALFGVALLSSSLFSLHPYLSLVGQFGQRSWAFFSVAALFVLAWFICQRAKTASFSSLLFFFVLGWLGLGGAGAWSLMQKEAFSAAGSVYALAVAMAVGLVVAVGCLMVDRRRLGGVFCLSGWPRMVVRGSIWLLLLLSMLIVSTVHFWLATTMVLVGCAFLLLSTWLPEQRFSAGLRSFVLPIFIMMFSVACLWFSLPWTSSLPGEVALSQRASSEIAQQTLVARPWMGTGPGTWVYDYAAYRSPALNASPYWAHRFDRGSSLLLTMFATTGMLGGVLFLLLVLAVFGVSVSFLLRVPKLRHHPFAHDAGIPIGGIVLSAWVVMVMAALFYNFNLAHQVFFWALTGCLLGLSARTHLFIDGARTPWSWILPVKAGGLLIAVLVLFITGGRALWAETRVGEAVSLYQLGQLSIDDVADRLRAARLIHPWDDTFTRTLAEAHLMRVLPQVKDKPAQERASLVGEEVSTMVELAREATRLAPANPDNWANAGLVYGGVASFTQGADAFAIAQYQEAIKRDPHHPDYPTQIGSLFLLRAQQLKVLLEAKDVAIQRQAVAQEQDALQQALQWTQRALSLKADYLPARYQRAVILNRQGKTQEALQELQAVVVLDPSPDRLFELGILSLQMGQSAQAMAAFEKVLALDATQMRARWQLASLYEEAGRWSDALAQLRLVAESVPTNTAVQKRLQVLQAQLNKVR